MSDLLPSRDVDAARRRAERIRIKARTISEQYESLRDLLDEAERCEDHLALGYASWTAYLADLFGDEPLRLPRDERIPMSAMLTDAGVSSRAAGQILGVDQKTIINDLRRGEEISSPEDSAPGEDPSLSTPERIDPLTGEVFDDDREPSFITPAPPAPAPQSVTGLDGKTYPKPTPKPEVNKPRRRPLTDAFSDGVYQLRLKVESLERLTRDDRFAANKEKAAQTDLHRLINTRDLLQQVIEQLS